MEALDASRRSSVVFIDGVRRPMDETDTVSA